MIIKEISELSDTNYIQINFLIKQLTTQKIEFTNEGLQKVIKSNNSILLGAFDELDLIGILTLIIYQIPTGKFGRIEDVVVDEIYRGKGIGKSLSLKAISIAKQLKIKRLFLTSNPYRMEANKLYQKIGFTLGETNSYFYDIV